MTTGDDLPDLLPNRRKRRPPRGGTPRPRYPSDSIDYKKRRNPDARPSFRVPLERWDDWEELRNLIGVDTTHATVIYWLLDGSRHRIDLLRDRAATEAARLLGVALHTVPTGPDTSTSDLHNQPEHVCIIVHVFFPFHSSYM